MTSNNMMRMSMLYQVGAMPEEGRDMSRGVGLRRSRVGEVSMSCQLLVALEVQSRVAGESSGVGAWQKR